MNVNRSVVFKLENLELVAAMQNKTKQNFSATLNIIIEQWDTFSLELIKLKRKQETQQELDRFDETRKIKRVTKK